MKAKFFIEKLAQNSRRQILSLLGFVLFFSHIKYGSGLEFYANQILIWLIYVFLHLYFGFRELCTKLYSMSWGNTQSWQEFDRFCEYNPVEVSMLTCLADVREPCQLGCRNLTYCTNFNNRQEQIFICGMEICH